jgi:hypothetical protein
MRLNTILQQKEAATKRLLSYSNFPSMAQDLNILLRYPPQWNPYNIMETYDAV